MGKLYVIVRADLPAGAQVAQSCHAMRLFSAEHTEIDRQWYAESNNLVCLQVPDEAALCELAKRARDHSVACSLFEEPDFQMEATALTISPVGRALVSNLPLALRT